MGELQGAKHDAAEVTVALVHTYVVAAVAVLVQLLNDPDNG